jgi:endonuclease/exonuclease/phosphatase family metal-dependent hydrolase
MDSFFARGWDPLRRDDFGVLWEHLVLEHLHAHFPDTPVRYWRDKARREIDFVLASFATTTRMTYNMDAGTDFVYFLSNPQDPATALGETLAELQGTDFAGRAGRLADKIGAEKPDLGSLQEVTVWDFVSTQSGARVGLVADQLALLTSALKARHQPYEVVAVQWLTNLQMPLGNGQSFHFLDRNVILARTDAPREELELSNVQSGNYQADVVVLDLFRQVNGWMSVDAKIHGRTLRLFATHLETAMSVDDETQMLQGRELIGIMNQSPYPVVLAGDLNSDMSGLGYVPQDQTPTASWIVAAGYTDCWTVSHAPYVGLTWPLYWEDTFVGHPPGPLERIDLIFARGLEAGKAKVVGNQAPFPSDHAGVVVTLDIRK